jgi:transcriptional regulator with XRE-family HTH domain
MSKTRAANGDRSLSGSNIKRFRKATIPELSQRALAEKMQLLNIDVDKNAVQRIESGERHVSDLELVTFAECLGVSVMELLNPISFSSK